MGNAADIQRRFSPGDVLLELRRLSPKLATMSSNERAIFICAQFGASPFNVKEVEVPEEVLRMVSLQVCRGIRCLPISFKDGRLTLCVADPTNQTISMVGSKLEIMIASQDDIMAAIDRLYGLMEAPTEIIG
ncbi:MAG: Type IV pilus biogenesis protein PilB [Candidatus Magasanikbacteria bacterium GW2011_GWC2_41_17]|uniref:Type IV pilus biogenesis protein PilB n=2 Tax=Candidatus Magasanikiibacteriota TaxID=1752731 RepID=A0A0G1D3E5_9BACT|nr:MAG: Type IV pilus biogenesis protein PilB [Candidatus Magasanikbacteria bacterium GW2011_GWC2_41_17]KKS56523.1 MAG: Type IV pilus biogenesis protein PilB [Candidatus Magasanikbacteria bacterium GW2011_GWA2_42_32]